MTDNLSPEARALLDAGKRVADEYGMHRTADPYGSIGKWMAVALTDGTSDHTLYDSKQDAIRGQHHNEFYYAYLQVSPANLTPKDAATFLALHRRMYDANLKLADREHPGGGYEMIRRTSREDQYNQVRALFLGDRPPSNLIIPGEFNG